MALFNSTSKNVNLLAFACFVFLCAWAIGYVFSIARAMFFGVLLFSAFGGVTQINDFVNLYMAGGMGLAAHAQPIYDPMYQLAWSNKLIAPAHLDKAFLCPYAPFVFVGLAPLALLPMHLAFVVWVLVSLLFFLFCIKRVNDEEHRLSRNDFIWLVVGVLASLPTYAAMYLGEVSFVVTGFVLLFYIAFKKKQDVPAGIFLALTVVKPTYTPFLCVPALALNRWRLLITAAIAELCLFALAGAVFGFNIFPSYIDVLLHGQSNPMFWGHNAEKMASLRGVLTMISPHLALYINLGVMLAAMGYMWLQWRRANLSDETDFRWLMALTVVASVCFNPHEHLHDCLPLVLPAMLTLNTVSFFKLLPMQPKSLRDWHVCFMLYPFLSVIVYLLWEFVPPVRLYATAFMVLDMLLLFCGVTYYKIWKASQGSQDTAVSNT